MASARTVFDYTLTSLLVASALAVATVAVRRELFPRTAPAATREVAGWEKLATTRPPVMGDAGARARVVLFSDFQCPYCRDLEGKLSATLPGLHGRVAVVRYDLPLTRVHAHAYQAAIAARCAARQGMAQAFDAALFRRDLDRPGLDFTRIAGESGVHDLAGFNACVHRPAIAHDVDADMALAHRLGIEGVPALIVDGKLYAGTMDAKDLQSLLSDAL
jgi:protein-disulfide isomerase